MHIGITSILIIPKISQTPVTLQIDLGENQRQSARFSLIGIYVSALLPFLGLSTFLPLSPLFVLTITPHSYPTLSYIKDVAGFLTIPAKIASCVSAAGERRRKAI